MYAMAWLVVAPFEKSSMLASKFFYNAVAESIFCYEVIGAIAWWLRHAGKDMLYEEALYLVLTRTSVLVILFLNLLDGFR
jgi:hypothetical protein